MSLNNFTIRQLIIACGFERKLKRSEICRVAGCSPSYLTRLMCDEDFKGLISSFESLPPDKDTLEYKGLGTLYAEVGRFVYLRGEKILRDAK